MPRFVLKCRMLVSACLLSTMLWGGIAYAADLRPVRKGVHVTYHEIRHLARRSGVVEAI